MGVPASTVASTNARVQADPRYIAAKRAYDAAVLAAPPKQTINDLRDNDSSDVAEGETRPEIIAAKQALGKVVSAIVQDYGLPGQPQAWLYDPDRGQVVYEEDHSLRNIGIAFGAIALGGGIANAVGGAGAVGGGVGIGETGATTGLAGSGFGSAAAGTGVAGAGTAAGTGISASSLSTPVITGTSGTSLSGLTGASFGAPVAAGGGTAAGVGGTAAVTGAATGGTAAGAGAGWAGLPEGVVGSGGVVGGTSAANVGGGLAATGGLGSLGWATLAGNVGSQAVGAYLQNRASNKATDAEAAANKAALDFAKEVYQTERADSAPYRALGQSSVNTLAQIMGQPATYVPPKDLPMQTDPNRIVPGQPFPASMVPGSPSNAALVPLIGPDGSRKAVPPEQVAHWTKLGARVDAGGSPTPTPLAAANNGGQNLSQVLARSA